jgi:hypothetical protein
MIDTALKILREQVENHLTLVNSNVVNSDGFVVLSNVADEDGKWAIPSNKIGMSIINVEEERVMKDQVFEHRNSNGVYERYNPELKLNLYVLFCANFINAGENYMYGEGLKQLSHVISFFQGKYVFTPDNTPGMDPKLRKLIVDIYSYSFEQQYNFWSILGAKYLPSVLYKVRLVSFQEKVLESQNLPIGEVEINTNDLNT